MVTKLVLFLVLVLGPWGTLQDQEGILGEQGAHQETATGGHKQGSTIISRLLHSTKSCPGGTECPSGNNTFYYCDNIYKE